MTISGAFSKLNNMPFQQVKGRTKRRDGSPCTNLSRSGKAACMVHDPELAQRRAERRKRRRVKRGRPAKIMLPELLLSQETLPCAGPKRNKEKRAEDLLLMQDLYLQGASRAQLAERFGISVKQVDYDLKKIRQEWQKERFSEIEEARDMARQRALSVMRLAWEAFDKSKRKSVRCRACNGGGKKACTVCKGMGRIEEEVPGDPDFLRLILKVLRDLRKLDGVDMPVNVPNGNTNVNFTLDAVIRRKEKERERSR